MTATSLRPPDRDIGAHTSAGNSLVLFRWSLKASLRGRGRDSETIDIILHKEIEMRAGGRLENDSSVLDVPWTTSAPRR